MVCCHLPRILVKGEGENKQLKSENVSLRDVLSKLVYSNVSQAGVCGRSSQPPVAMGARGKAPSRWAIFVFFEKKAILIPLDHISHVFTAI